MIDKAMKETKKPKLSDVERHKRFVEVGRLVGASESSEDFDKAFDGLSLKTNIKFPKPIRGA